MVPLEVHPTYAWDNNSRDNSYLAHHNPLYTYDVNPSAFGDELQWKIMCEFVASSVKGPFVDEWEFWGRCRGGI